MDGFDPSAFPPVGGLLLLVLLFVVREIASGALKEAGKELWTWFQAWRAKTDGDGGGRGEDRRGDGSAHGGKLRAPYRLRYVQGEGPRDGHRRGAAAAKRRWTERHVGGRP